MTDTILTPSPVAATVLWHFSTVRHSQWRIIHLKKKKKRTRNENACFNFFCLYYSPSRTLIGDNKLASWLLLVLLPYGGATKMIAGIDGERDDISDVSTAAGYRMHSFIYCSLNTFQRSHKTDAHTTNAIVALSRIRRPVLVQETSELLMLFMNQYFSFLRWIYRPRLQNEREQGKLCGGRTISQTKNQRTTWRSEMREIFSYSFFAACPLLHLHIKSQCNQCDRQLKL